MGDRDRAFNILTAALRETVPNFDPAWVQPSTHDGHESVIIHHVPLDVRRKAIRLAWMAVGGPSQRVICDAHHVPGRADLWRACGRVQVCDALRGHVCGKPVR